MRTIGATFGNCSPLPRRHWGVVTVPRELAFDRAEATFHLEDGRSFRAVRGQSRGCKTIYRTRLTMGGHELLSGVLVDEPLAPVTTHKTHRWVKDDFTQLIPRTMLDPQGHAHLREVESSPAHSRWTFKTRANGLHFQWWADILSDDPVVPITGKVIYSDPTDPRTGRPFDRLMLETGEYVAFDFAVRHGMLAPVRLPTGEWVTMLNDARVLLQDGAGLPLSGAMLCFESIDKGRLADPEDTADEDVAGVRDLQAGAHGPIVGVCHEWNGHFIANGWIPRFTPHFPEMRIAKKDAEIQAWLNSLEQRAGWFAPRPLGCLPKPSTTGDQEDFGATKGTWAVTLHDPRWIWMARYAVQSELFRGVQRYEADGEPLRLEDHEEWVTWNMVTHWHEGVSPDRLGKASGVLPVSSTGWDGYDDQHRSQNNLAAYLCLTDDPLMDDHVRHQTTCDEAAYRVKYPHFGAGAARAQGRTNHTLAQLAAVMDDETARRLATVIAQRMVAVKSNWLLQVPGPMRVLSVNGPDARKPVFDENGELAASVSLWEHGLAMVGFMPFWRAGQYHGMILDVAHTMQAFGFFQDDEGQYHTVLDILWKGGSPPPGRLEASSPHVSSVLGAGSVGFWTFNGLLAAREVLREEEGPTPRLDAYIKSITHGDEAWNRRNAEWWAAVETVVKGP